MAKEKDIRKVAIAMAKEIGLLNIYQKDLCERAGVSVGSFAHYVGCSFTDYVVSLKQYLPASAHGINKKRLGKAARIDDILDAAINIAEVKGYTKVTWKELGDASGVSLGLLVYHFGSIQEFKRTLMRAAITRKNLTILAQGLAVKDEHAIKAPDELKQSAIALLFGV